MYHKICIVYKQTFRRAMLEYVYVYVCVCVSVCICQCVCVFVDLCMPCSACVACVCVCGRWGGFYIRCGLMGVLFNTVRIYVNWACANVPGSLVERRPGQRIVPIDGRRRRQHLDVFARSLRQVAGRRVACESERIGDYLT